MAAKKSKSRKAAKKPAARKAAKRRTPTRRKSAAAARPKRREPQTLRLSDASPGFTVNDIERSLAWYTDVLGFVAKERWMREGKLAGVELLAGSTTFMIGQDDWQKGRERKKGEGFRIYCTTSQDVDRLAALIKARGGKLDHEPADQPWGMRDFAVQDPDGFKITIGASLKR
jgi:uncharacterized glyoxalase superfamily protein PhnB